jgi:putative hydrolase of the HAD superfamily
MLNNHLETLERTIRSADDYELALRHAPRIRFDAREPFFPLAVGYTVFHHDALSPSFPRQIMLPPGTACAIEYAVWWDWDIEHLYELEHIWIYLDADETVVAGDASWHGSFHVMADENGQPPLEQGRLTLYSEPGKHAFAPSPQGFKEREVITRNSCGVQAGKLGVHVTPLFEGIIHSRKPLANRLVHTYLERQGFTPTYDFSQIFQLDSVIFVPWDNLFRWIPGRVDAWIQHLNATIAPYERRLMRIAHRGASAYAPEN